VSFRDLDGLINPIRHRSSSDSIVFAASMEPGGRPEETTGCTGYGPGMGELYEGA